MRHRSHRKVDQNVQDALNEFRNLMEVSAPQNQEAPLTTFSSPSPADDQQQQQQDHHHSPERISNVAKEQREMINRMEKANTRLISTNRSPPESSLFAAFPSLSDKTKKILEETERQNERFHRGRTYHQQQTNNNSNVDNAYDDDNHYNLKSLPKQQTSNEEQIDSVVTPSHLLPYQGNLGLLSRVAPTNSKDQTEISVARENSQQQNRNHFSVTSSSTMTGLASAAPYRSSNTMMNAPVVGSVTSIFASTRRKKMEMDNNSSSRHNYSPSSSIPSSSASPTPSSFHTPSNQRSRDESSSSSSHSDSRNNDDYRQPLLQEREQQIAQNYQNYLMNNNSSNTKSNDENEHPSPSTAHEVEKVQFDRVENTQNDSSVKNENTTTPSLINSSSNNNNIARLSSSRTHNSSARSSSAISTTSSTRIRSTGGANRRPGSAVDKLKQMIDDAESENVERRKKRQLIKEVEESRQREEQQEQDDNDTKKSKGSDEQQPCEQERNEEIPTQEDQEHRYGENEQGPSSSRASSVSSSVISEDNEDAKLLRDLQQRNWEKERQQRRELLQQEQEQALTSFLEQRKLTEAVNSLSWDEKVDRSDIELQEKIGQQELSEYLFDAMLIVRQVSALESLELHERGKIFSRWSNLFFHSLCLPFLQTVEKRDRNVYLDELQVWYNKKYRLMMYEETVVNLAVQETYAREEVFVDWEDELPSLHSEFSKIAVVTLSRERWLVEVDEANDRGAIENELTEFFMHATEGQRWSKPLMEKRAGETVKARQQWKQHLTELKSEILEMEQASRRSLQRVAFQEMKRLHAEEFAEYEEIADREEKAIIDLAIQQAQRFNVANSDDATSVLLSRSIDTSTQGPMADRSSRSNPNSGEYTRQGSLRSRGSGGEKDEYYQRLQDYNKSTAQGKQQQPTKTTNSNNNNNRPTTNNASSNSNNKRIVMSTSASKNDSKHQHAQKENLEDSAPLPRQHSVEIGKPRGDTSSDLPSIRSDELVRPQQKGPKKHASTPNPKIRK